MGIQVCNSKMKEGMGKTQILTTIKITEINKIRILVIIKMRSNQISKISPLISSRMTFNKKINE